MHDETPATPTAENSHKIENTKKPKRRGRRLPNYLRQAEADALVAACEAALARAKSKAKRHSAGRDLLMVRVGASMGLRVSELCNLEVQSLDLADGSALVEHGKGDKDRMVPIPAKLMGALAEWVGNRRVGYLFPGPKGKRLNPRTFQLRLKKLAKEAGIVRRVHPHCLRHTAATALLKRGASIRVVQAVLGHSHLSTTEIYTHVEVSDLKEAMDKL